jgi:predicted MFS family arabinose efflux permease
VRNHGRWAYSPSVEYQDAMYNEGSSPKHTAVNFLTRDFVLVFLAYFAFIAANHALIPTLPIYLTKLGSTERQVGVLVGIAGVAALVSRFVVGGVLTRYLERRAMIVGAALIALTFPAVIIFSHFWPLFAVRIFQGIALACFHTAALAHIVKIVPLVYRGQGIAYFMLAPNLALTLVAPSGMFLVNQYGFTIFFLSCMSLSVCSFFLSWKVKGSKTLITPEQSALARSVFLPEWKIAVPAITNFLQMFVYGGFTAFLPLYALECGIINPGHFFTAQAVLIIVGRLLGGRVLDTYNKEKIIMTSIPISIVAMIILSFSKTLPLFIFVGLLWGMGTVFFIPACMSYALEYAGSSGGAAVGTYWAFMDLGMALGPLFAGIIVPFTGYSIMFLCLALICLINMGYFQFYVRRRSSVVHTV